MATKKEAFNAKMIKFKGKKFPLTIPGGRKGYWVTEVTEKYVQIKQGKTLQNHAIDQLEALFVVGEFVGPVNGQTY